MTVTIQLIPEDWPPFPALCASGECAHAAGGKSCNTKGRLAQAHRNAAKRVGEQNARERTQSAGHYEPWDVAEFRCGTCGEHVKAETEAAYVKVVMEHRAKHDRGQ